MSMVGWVGVVRRHLYDAVEGKACSVFGVNVGRLKGGFGACTLFVLVSETTAFMTLILTFVMHIWKILGS